MAVAIVRDAVSKRLQAPGNQRVPFMRRGGGYHEVHGACLEEEGPFFLKETANYIYTLASRYQGLASRKEVIHPGGQSQGDLSGSFIRVPGQKGTTLVDKVIQGHAAKLNGNPSPRHGSLCAE